MPICITGMHRSGTSMIAHLLKECGLYLGSDEKIKNAAKDNPEGFWEHPEFVEINNQILEEFGGGWDLAPSFPTDWGSSARVQPQKNSAKRLINQFQQYKSWGWKDPRNSFTLPFWKTQIPDLKIVIVVRNPASVALSLSARGASSYSFSTKLWLNHYLQLMKDALSQDHIITHYDAYFLNPAAELRRIINFIGIPASEETINNATAIVKQSLRNNSKKLNDLLQDHTSQEVIEKYLELCSSAGSIYQVIAEHELSEVDSIFTNDETPTTSNTLKIRDITSLRISFLQRIIKEASHNLTELNYDLQALLRQNAEKDQALQTLNTQNAEKDQALQTLNTQMLDLNKSVDYIQTQLVDRQKMIDVRDEGIEWLRNELTLAQMEIKRIQANRFWRMVLVYRSLRVSVASATYLIRHPFMWFRQKNIYQSFLKRMPGPIKQFLKKLLGLAPSAKIVSSFITPMESDRILEKSKRDEFYDSLTIFPTLSSEEKTAVLNYELSAKQIRQTDIICFSIIDWDARYQRPQQIMSQFAEHGHRVFYISTSQFQTAETTPKVKVRIIRENIYEISLAIHRPPDVYGELIDGKNLELAIEALKDLRHIYKIEEAVSYVMISSWSAIALKTMEKWSWKVIYDCMDEWNNFPLIKRAIIDAELNLVQKCDLLLVTSRQLYETWKKYKRPMVLVRNATDYQFYEQHYLPNTILPETDQPIVGYYGAIADWFDLQLMVYIAKQRTNYMFILLGGVFDVDVSQLKDLPNVKLLGQQPYETMPQYLYHFNACIIPFKINAITEATDPVKIYEYLSGGKPVVSVTLSELKPYSELLYLAENKDDFLFKLDKAVVENDPELVLRRQEFARQNTWDKRYKQIINELATITPRVSIIVTTYNNLALTKLCLHSIIKNTGHLNYEIIVVDNNSTDGSQVFLRDFSAQHSNLSIITNSTNKGFAKANNQGLTKATGEYLVLLNNDTIVSPGWLHRLIRYLQDPQVGLVGPLSNFVGNEAKLDVTYHSWAEMEVFAKQNAIKNEGLVAEIHMLAMYCVAFRQDVHEIIGPLDESFGIGMFEDDDYSQRVRAKGYKVICAQDVFIHHFGQAAFRELILNNTYNHLFEENKQRYEAKWNIKWLPHKHAKLHPTYYPIRIDRPKLVDNQYSSTTTQQDEYAKKILHENIKWGEHLKLEESGEWHAWLDHPMIVNHYLERGLMDELNWKQWVNKKLGRAAKKSLDLGCGAGACSLDLWNIGSSKIIEGMDVSNDRVAEGEKQRLKIQAPGKFWVADINRIILPENSYDLIFSAHSFHHFLDLEHIMDQASGALTQDGLFILEEFVGPTQFQWTDLQMKYTKDLLSSLPKSLRMFRDGRVKNEEGRPTPDEVMAVSPFESIRSSEILPLFKKYFDVIAIRNLGGTIQHLLYNGIIHNFTIDNQEATQHVQSIIKTEDHLIDSGQLPSDFMLLVGKKRN